MATRLHLLNGPFRGSHALAEGIVTKKQLYSPLVRRLFKDVYVPLGLDITHELRCRAAALIAPPEAMLTGHSAATIYGLAAALPDDPVEFAVDEACKFGPFRGMHIRRVPVSVAEHAPWKYGACLATPLRMTFDLLTNTRLRPSLGRAVGWLDMSLRSGRVEFEEFAALLARRHEHGVIHARRALEFADARAESIPESELRVVLIRAGLDPEVQFEVYHHGRWLGRLDLAFPDAKLAVEYDGQWHFEEAAQVEHDAIRRAGCRAAGWEFVLVTKEELYGNPDAIVCAVRNELRRRIPREVADGRSGVLA